jgi:hypothetical protein
MNRRASVMACAFIALERSASLVLAAEAPGGSVVTNLYESLSGRPLAERR